MSGAFDQELDDAEGKASQPISLRGSIGEAEAFPLEALSPTIRGAIEAIVDIVQAPAAIVAQAVLAAIALVCQHRYNIRLPTRREVPTALFLFSVAISGDRKSSTEGLALKPVFDRERALKQIAAGDEAAYEIELAAFEAAKASAKRGSGSRAEKSAALAAVGAAPIKPAAGILVTDEATVPGLQKLFAEAMPSLGLFSDEGAAWLGGWSMSDENAGATGASLSSLWDGKPIKRVRATGFEMHYGRRLSVHLMVQPGVALKLFGNKTLRDQGTMSRILVAFPKSMRGERFWREPSEDSWEALRVYHDRLTARLGEPMLFVDPATRELQFATLDLSPEARDLWIAFSDFCERQQAPGCKYEDIGDFASKMPENAARLAAVLANFECKPSTLSAGGIGEKFMAAGIRLAEYYGEEALRLFGAGSVDDDSDNAQMLIDWIRKKGLSRVGAQYLSQSGPKPIRPAAPLKRALNMLVEHHHLVPIKGGATLDLGGKSKFYKEAYVVPPVEPA